MSIQLLGSARQPECVLYLPNPPQWDTGKPLDLPSLIQANGNHWRKILTIFAKLRCTNDNWREYRDQELLQSAELICFADKLIETASTYHLIAGKANWQRMGFRQGEFKVLDDNRLYQKGRVFLTPYPDYRQFPNQLIHTLKPLIS